MTGLGAWNTYQKAQEIKQIRGEAQAQVAKAISEISRMKEEIETLAAACKTMHGTVKELTDSVVDMAQRKGADQTFTEEQRQQLEKATTAEDLPPDVTQKARGLQAEAQGRWNDAIDIWKRESEKAPKDTTFLFRLAYSYQQAAKKDPSQAESLLAQAAHSYQKLTDIDSKDAKAFSNWGVTLDDWGKLAKDVSKFEQACEKFQRATDIDPNYAAAFYNWGNALADWGQLVKDSFKFEQACEKYQRATGIDPNCAAAFYNWGSALTDWGKLAKDASKFEQACEKYQRTTEIDPKNAVAFYNWSSTLGNWSHLVQDPTRRRALLLEARIRAARAEELEPGKGAYNLACVAAQLGEPEECRRWLKACLAHGTMPSCDHLRTDTDLDPVRGEVWFRDILAKVCGDAPPVPGDPASEAPEV